MAWLKVAHQLINLDHVVSVDLDATAWDAASNEYGPAVEITTVLSDTNSGLNVITFTGDEGALVAEFFQHSFGPLLAGNPNRVYALSGPQPKTD